jgi:CheY-like chemotaxis protein
LEFESGPLLTHRTGAPVNDQRISFHFGLDTLAKRSRMAHTEKEGAELSLILVIMSIEDRDSEAAPASTKELTAQGSKDLLVLLVEDEPDQALLVQDVLGEDSGFGLLQVVQSGEEAIAYLSGIGRFADRATYPVPSLMLLDLKMPGIGGFGVLRWLQTRPDLREQMHTVVLSSMQSSKEIELAGELGVKQYWVKSDWMLLRQRIRHLKASLCDEDPW